MEPDLHTDGWNKESGDQPVSEGIAAQSADAQKPITGIGKLILKLGSFLDQEKLDSFKSFDENGLQIAESETTEGSHESAGEKGMLAGESKPADNDGSLRTALKNLVLQKSFARSKDPSEAEVKEENRRKQEKIEHNRETKTQMAALKHNEEPAKAEETPPVKPMFLLVVGLAIVFAVSLTHILTSGKRLPDVAKLEPTAHAPSNPVASPTIDTAALSAVKDVKTILQKARKDYADGNKMKALNELFAATSLAPKDATVYVARGNYYLSEHDIASASADYQHALELNSRLGSAKKQLARCHALQRKEDTSSSDDKPSMTGSEMAEVSNLDFYALRRKAYSALESNRLDFAVSALSRCVTMNPNDALSRRYLAFAALKNGNVALAISQFSAWDILDRTNFGEKLDFGKAVAASQGNDGQVTTTFFDNLIRARARDAEALIEIAQTTIDLGISSGPSLRALRSASAVASSTEKGRILSLYEQLNSKQDAPSGGGGSTGASAGPLQQEQLPPGFDLEDYRARTSKPSG